MFLNVDDEYEIVPQNNINKKHKMEILELKQQWLLRKQQIVLA